MRFLGGVSGFSSKLPRCSANSSRTVSDLLCRQQALSLEQAISLGPREDMDDIYRAFEKVYEQRAALADWSRRAGTR